MSAVTEKAAAPADRVDFIDALRGFALFGLFMVHMPEMFELYWLNPVPDPVHALIFGLFAGKAYALLALCFGFSFQAMGERAMRRGEDFAGRFAWRLVLLFGFGILHGLVYRGDIIIVLALIGFLLIPFFKVPSRPLLTALIALAFLNPYLLVRIAAAFAGAEWANALPAYMGDTTLGIYATGSFTEALAANLGAGGLMKWSYYFEGPRAFTVFGLFLVGLMLGRSGAFARDVSPGTHARRIGLASLGLVATMMLADAASPLVAAHPGPGFHVGLLVGGWQDLAATVLTAVLCHAAWQSALRPALALFTAPGRMTLTLYLGQSLVFVPVFYGWGLGAWAWMSQAQTALLGLAAFAVQIAFARLWMRRFHYGPLEWLWRAGTRRTRAVPFRRA